MGDHISTKALHNTSTILVEFINTYWLVMLVTGEGVSQ